MRDHSCEDFSEKLYLVLAEVLYGNLPKILANQDYDDENHLEKNTRASHFSVYSWTCKKKCCNSDDEDDMMILLLLMMVVMMIY